ncbi:unnamed protein product [Moneuplotes crassus]|uniref:Uncharacterized protein n=1 Tax=Euplotes crassus TaxID=5936 RepID=A0AAD1XY84_EUPCR|nr:unnamed protein product [Moneuplotes crassus]
MIPDFTFKSPLLKDIPEMTIGELHGEIQEEKKNLSIQLKTRPSLSISYGIKKSSQDFKTSSKKQHTLKYIKKEFQAAYERLRYLQRKHYQKKDPKQTKGINWKYVWKNWQLAYHDRKRCKMIPIIEMNCPNDHYEIKDDIPLKLIKKRYRKKK